MLICCEYECRKGRIVVVYVWDRRVGTAFRNVSYID
jgi:hypothetical protein